MEAIAANLGRLQGFVLDHYEPHIVNATTLVPPGHTPNFLEQQWLNMFDGRDELLTVTVFSFVFHELVYFGRFLPFWACDFIPFFRKYKIQDNKENTGPQIWKCFKHLLFAHFFIQLPMMLGFQPMARMFGMKVAEVPFPSLGAMAFQIALFFLFEDFWHYWMHRAMHYGPLYKHIHKVHHEYSAPFGLAAEYAHPLETLILGQGTILGPLMYVTVTGDLHFITVIIWVMVRLVQAVDAHSGYDFPWSLHNFLPFWAGADHHDYHHMTFLNNFSSSFRWWDTMFGTDTKYHAHKAKIAAAADDAKARKAQ
ncbi:hypothetical protein GQ42DRAFT_161792 [Ramicandelaber brevisporus]|nr:hypothetical protein GQ42DRAFT_161792 [Ramicandelaber brevisporus]